MFWVQGTLPRCACRGIHREKLRSDVLFLLLTTFPHQKQQTWEQHSWKKTFIWIETAFAHVFLTSWVKGKMKRKRNSDLTAVWNVRVFAKDLWHGQSKCKKARQGRLFSILTWAASVSWYGSQKQCVAESFYAGLYFLLQTGVNEKAGAIDHRGKLPILEEWFIRLQLAFISMCSPRWGIGAIVARRGPCTVSFEWRHEAEGSCVVVFFSVTIGVRRVGSKVLIPKRTRKLARYRSKRRTFKLSREVHLQLPYILI